MALSIKKGDTVIVTDGKDRGKQGKVVRVLKTDNKILVEGVNVYKRHRKSRGQNQKGQIVDRSMPLNFSNVLLYCDSCKKGVRFGHSLDSKKKERVCKQCSKKI